MLLLDYFDIKLAIETSKKNIDSRKECFDIRKDTISNKKGIVKLAFDTRRIDQETTFIPRRGLQNYNRSEQFLSEATAKKLTLFKKLKEVLSKLHERYGKEPEWQDSYARILLNSLDKCLRSNINDQDYSDSQQSVASIDYIEELLYVRYRITLDSLLSLTDQQIEDIILSKDLELKNKQVKELVAEGSQEHKITRADISNMSYDSLMEKLFGGIKADKNNKKVKRTVTISIEDSVEDEEEK